MHGQVGVPAERRARLAHPLLGPDRVGASEYQRATALRTPRSPGAKASGRPRQRARNQSTVHGPIPGRAVNRSRIAGRRRRPGRGRRPQARGSSDLAAREPEPVQVAAVDIGRPRERPPLAAFSGDAPAEAPDQRLRIAQAACSDTCWAVTDVTSISNGSASSGGRKPGARACDIGVGGGKAGDVEAHARAGAQLGRVGGAGLAVPGLGAAGRDPHRQARAQHPVQAAVVPAAGQVVAERAEAEGRALEVVVGRVVDHPPNPTHLRRKRHRRCDI